MTEPRASPEEIREEQRRARFLRILVDLTATLIAQERPSRAEAERMVEGVRRQALELFPGKEETFELIYRPRFRRLIEEFARPGGRVLPFRETGPEEE